MSVAIRPEIVKLLEAQVAAGRFASVEAAIETMALDDAAAWARPYIEKGLADIEAGRTRPSADVHVEMRARYRSGS
jgi:predicted transcriptional regulator